jgi:hypothetical protein
MDYQAWIRAGLLKVGAPGIDARHAEAYLRLDHGTLDGLDTGQMIRELPEIVATIEDCPAGAEALAQSFGL